MKRHVSFINCSFSKILVGVAGFTALLILIKTILRQEGQGQGQGQGQGPGPPTDGHQRRLKTADAAADDAPFIDILREKPKVWLIFYQNIGKGPLNIKNIFSLAYL